MRRLMRGKKCPIGTRGEITRRVKPLAAGTDKPEISAGHHTYFMGEKHCGCAFGLKPIFNTLILPCPKKTSLKLYDN